VWARRAAWWGGGGVAFCMRVVYAFCLRRWREPGAVVRGVVGCVPHGLRPAAQESGVRGRLRGRS